MSVTVETATKLGQDFLKQVGGFCQTHIAGRFSTQFPEASAKIATIATPVIQQLKRIDPTFVAGVAATFFLGKAISYVGARWQANRDYANAEKTLKTLEKEITDSSWDLKAIEDFYSLVSSKFPSSANVQVKQCNSANEVHSSMAAYAKPYLDVTRDADSALSALESLWLETASTLPQPQRSKAFQAIETAVKAAKTAQGEAYDQWLPHAEIFALSLLRRNDNYKHLQNCGSNNTLHNLTPELITTIANGISDAASAWKALGGGKIFLLNRSNMGRPDGVGPTGGLGERWPKEINVLRLERDPPGLALPVAKLLAEKKLAMAKASPAGKLPLAEECKGLHLILAYARNPKSANLAKIAAHYDDFDANSFSIITDTRQIGINNMTREGEEELMDLGKATNNSQLAQSVQKLVKSRDAILESTSGFIVDTSFLKASLLSGKPFQFVYPNVFTTAVKSSDWSRLEKNVVQAKKSKETIVNPVSHFKLEADNCNIVPLTKALCKFGFDPATKQPTSTALITNSEYADGCYRYAHEWVLVAPKKMMEIFAKKQETLAPAFLSAIGAQVQKEIRENDKKPHLFSILTAAHEIYRTSLFDMPEGEAKNEAAYKMLVQELSISGVTMRHLQAIDQGALDEYNKQNPTAKLQANRFAIGSTSTFSAT